MKTLTIAALLVASVLLMGVAGATSPAYANHPVLVEGESDFNGDGLFLWKAFYNSFFGIFGR